MSGLATRQLQIENPEYPPPHMSLALYCKNRVDIHVMRSTKEERFRQDLLV